MLALDDVCTRLDLLEDRLLALTLLVERLRMLAPDLVAQVIDEIGSDL